MKKALAPAIADSSRILILGTMPGEESLRQQQYYANPYNQFWRILSAVYHAPLSENYAERLAFLHQKQLALWDVFEYCEREGSADTDIKNAVSNDFQSLLQTYKQICIIAFNGKKAYKWFEQKIVKQQVLGNAIQLAPFPSTSAAAAISFAEKVRRWGKLAEL